MEPKRRLRFSFVIPAHNEEKYLEATLSGIASLEYPADLFETIVIENGSIDGTLEITKRFKTCGMTILQSERGVSKARNTGIDALSPESDWVIFLDADTILKRNFLKTLDLFLRTQPGARVGTTALRPSPNTVAARAWFVLYNLGHRIQKTSLSILIAHRSLMPALRFDETLEAGEDLDFIRRALRHGGFFFMQTRDVSTSTRRFEAHGWLRTSLFLFLGSLLPARLRRSLHYKPVR